MHDAASSGSLRVLRGGSWNNNANNARSANRNNNNPSNRNNNNGFRLASTGNAGVRAGTPHAERALQSSPLGPWCDQGEDERRRLL